MLKNQLRKYTLGAYYFHDIAHCNGHGICVSNSETSLAFDSLLEINLGESAQEIFGWSLPEEGRNHFYKRCTL